MFLNTLLLAAALRLDCGERRTEAGGLLRLLQIRADNGVPHDNNNEVE